MKNLKHKCGVCGVIGHPDSATITIAGMISQQHRGQGQSGLAAKRWLQWLCFRWCRIRLLRRQGLVAELINRFSFQQLWGKIAIGHNRYPTAGPPTVKNAQPHLSRNKKIALCSNGDIVPSDYAFWKAEMNAKGFGSISDNDGELLLRILEWRLSCGDGIVDALRVLQNEVEGAFSLLVIYDDQLIACRDRKGFRPLVYGGRTGENTRMVASESCAMIVMGADYWEEIEPGEIRIINANGSYDQYFLPPLEHRSQCVFELIYFAFPTSRVFGIPVSLFRERLGALLARFIPAGARLVMPVPDSANHAAVGLANASGLPFRMGFTRTHFSGRSFIASEHAERDRIADLKLSADPGILDDEEAVVVDDSIVRGTTSKRTMTKLHEAGTRLIHLRIISPPITHPCYYGVSTPTKDELIANGKTVEEIREFIGADSLVYLTLDDLKAVIRSFGKDPDDFCFACFTGEYPTPL